MSFRIKTPIGKVFQKITTSFSCVINASTYNVMHPNTRILTLDENFESRSFELRVLIEIQETEHTNLFIFSNEYHVQIIPLRSQFEYIKKSRLTIYSFVW